jgi:hypothetical protein
VVETIRLESGHTLTGIVGSNPTLSAILVLKSISSDIVDFRNRSDEDGTIPVFRNFPQSLNPSDWLQHFPGMFPTAHKTMRIRRPHQHACSEFVTGERFPLLPTQIPVTKLQR